MRQATTILSLLGSFIIFALTVNLFETSVMFVLFGILPDGSQRLSANQMLTIYLAATVLVLGNAFRSSTAGAISALRSHRPKHSHAA